MWAVDTVPLWIFLSVLCLGLRCAACSLLFFYVSVSSVCTFSVSKYCASLSLFFLFCSPFSLSSPCFPHDIPARSQCTQKGYLGMYITQGGWGLQYRGTVSGRRSVEEAFFAFCTLQYVGFSPISLVYHRTVLRPLSFSSICILKCLRKLIFDRSGSFAGILCDRVSFLRVF